MTTTEYKHHFTVKFVGDYFVLITDVDATDDDDAYEQAKEQIERHYGWAVDKVPHHYETVNNNEYPHGVVDAEFFRA